MQTQPYLLQALSPLHAGTGQALDIIDLPIARMRATGIPIVPGSSIKGVLRDARRSGNGGAPPKDALLAVFGPEQTDDTSAHAGALVVGDAHLLALPVRSFRGTVAWVTCPLLLELARRDLRGVAGLPGSFSLPSGNCARVAEGSLNLHTVGQGTKVYFEDLDLPAGADAAATEWARFLAGLLFADGGERQVFEKRFAVVDDETMTFLWETATQVDTRVRLDPKTRTVAKGALWTEESLPAETVLLGLIAADRSRKPGQEDLKPAGVLKVALPGEETLQFGGKATVGRGRCRMVPISLN
ncbi:MAG: type III-B CRISPR module RAMP protein Cmr4 [Candidatus Sericytochromatia bacterium]|nr:type III-B CRISPR module RAMP protein Cmr4 [Candidatus Tanganyikabacteria bacterium]